MGRKNEERNIDGLEVVTTQLPALDSFALMAKLGRIISPVVSGIAPGQNKLASLMQRDLGPALIELFKQLDESDIKALCRSILVETHVKYQDKLVQLNTKEKIDLVFSGNLMGLIGTIKFVLEVNYADFFGAARTYAAALEKVASSQATDSQSTSTPK